MLDNRFSWLQSCLLFVAYLHRLCHILFDGAYTLLILVAWLYLYGDRRFIELVFNLQTVSRVLD